MSFLNCSLSYIEARSFTRTRSSDCSFSLFGLHVQSPESRDRPPSLPNSHKAAMEPNSRPRACLARVLHTEPLPSSTSTFKKKQKVGKDTLGNHETMFNKSACQSVVQHLPQKDTYKGNVSIVVRVERNRVTNLTLLTLTLTLD